MTTRTRTARIALTCIVTVVAGLGSGSPPAGAAPETFDLRVRYTEGEIYDIEQTSSFDITGKMQMGATPIDTAIYKKDQTSMREVVIHVDEDGSMPTRIRRKYGKVVITQQAPGSGTRAESDSPLSNQTLFAEVTDGKTQVTPLVEGALKKRDTRDVRIGRDDNAILPTEPVAVGHEWTADGEAIGRFLNDPSNVIEKGEMTAKFVSIVTREAARLAKIELSLTFTGKIAGLIKSTSTLKGTVTIDLDDRKVIEASLAGDADIDDNANVGGMRVKITGSGKISLEFKRTLLDI